jgi:hypothetical protein
MSSYLYAAYGSNLHPVRLQRRVSSASLVGTCLLPGHDLRFHKIGRLDGSGKCSIVSGEKGVYLAVFEIEESQQSALDRVEGLNQGYNAVYFKTEEFGRCFSYVADASAIDNTKKPMDWYKEMVLLGCRVNEFPIDYVRQIENVPSIVDPDRVRAARQWGIVEELRRAR